MIRLALHGSWRRFRASPALTVLPVTAIGLGAAAVLSVQLLNRAALASLDASLEAVSPGADLRVESLVVAPGAVPDSAWPAVLRVPGVAAAAPVVRLPEVVVAPLGPEAAPAVPLLVWGVDLISGRFASLGDGEDGAGGHAAPDAFFAGGLALPRSVADALGARLLDPVRVVSGDRGREAVVAALTDADGGGAGFMDIAFAQGLRGRSGLDRIEVRLREGVDPDVVAAAIAARVPGVRAISGATLREEGADLFAAFRLNLTALSAVSLLVAAFLVSASVRAMLVLRRREIGLYRALGASREGVFRALLLEVALIGLVGAAAGIPLGFLGASAALDQVAATVTNFYLLERIESLRLTPEVAALAILVAVGAALLGALGEVFAASGRAPAELLRPGRRMPAPSARATRWRRLIPGVAGGGLLLFAGAAALHPEGDAALLGGGFAAGAAALVGAALLPRAGLALARRAVGSRGRGTAFFRGVGAALREPGSTGAPAAALTVAVAILVGVAALVGSFRETLDAWLRQTLVADIYVSSFGARGPSRREPLDPATVDALLSAPEVMNADLLRALPVRMEGRPVQVFGIRPALPRAAERFAFLDKPEGTMDGLAAGGVLISEPLARRLGLARGDLLDLPGSRAPPPAAGPARAPIVGVFRDYGNEAGSLFLDRARMARLYPSGVEAGGVPDGPVHGVALYLRPGADVAAVSARLARELPATLGVADNERLRRRALRVFDQTMAVTGLLEVLALAIAVLGLALSLWTLARERAAETALLRALGESRFEAGAGFVGRGALIGALALVLGGGAGALLTLLLVRVVNPLWFGWSLELHWPLASLAGDGVVVLVVGMAAGLVAARLASRTGASALVAEV